MEDKKKQSTENVMNTSENEKANICGKCGKDANCFDENNNMWLCEECKNIQEETSKQLIKMEKKLSKRPFSFNLKTLIEALSKDEIYNIARNLGVNRISGLNKDKLVEKLVEEYRELVKERLDLLDNERYSILKTYLVNGVKFFDNVNEYEADRSAYFIQQGLLYPAIKESKSLFLMPTVVQDLLHQKDTAEYINLLQNNTEIIDTYRGLNKVYGILDTNDACRLVKEHHDIDGQLLENLIKESGYYYNEYRFENSMFINNEIDNYEEFLKDLDKQKDLEYAKISKEEIISMCDKNWVAEIRAGKSFYKEFTSMFKVDRDMTIAMMEDLVLDVQEYEVKEAVEKMIELIKIEDERAKIAASNMMTKFLNKIRLWRYKGNSTNDIKAKELSSNVKKVVGRNDPCPCGSGKKYKKCCG